MDTPKPPSGRDIWRAIKDELAANLYPLPFSTLAPARYHVYLHPADYETIEGVVPRIVSEAARALTAEVQRVNRRQAGRRSRVWAAMRQAERSSPVEMPAGGWEIYIQPDQDGELERGAFGIVSKLTLPATPAYAGTPTTRIVRTVFTEGRRTASLAREEPSADTAAKGEPPPTEAANQTSAPAAAAAQEPECATLVYEDEEGTHRFVMKKSCIKVGRGGMGAWVDVQVITNPRVSREHCWIQCDPSGQFFIQDVSKWGTSVNGEPIPPAVRSPEGAVIHAGARHELPTEARIGLADALVMQFVGGARP